MCHSKSAEAPAHAAAQHVLTMSGQITEVLQNGHEHCREGPTLRKAQSAGPTAISASDVAVFPRR
eukprot:14105322-Alexandrium_andersonii.AAC.1